MRVGRDTKGERVSEKKRRKEREQRHPFYSVVVAVCRL